MATCLVFQLSPPYGVFRCLGNWTTRLACPSDIVSSAHHANWFLQLGSQMAKHFSNSLIDIQSAFAGGYRTHTYPLDIVVLVCERHLAGRTLSSQYRRRGEFCCDSLLLCWHRKLPGCFRSLQCPVVELRTLIRRRIDKYIHSESIVRFYLSPKSYLTPGLRNLQHILQRIH